MRQNFIKFIAILTLASFALVPAVSLAEATSTNSQINNISAMLEQIKAMQAQIEALKASQGTLKAQAATQIGAFVASLQLGSSGDDVKALQALLAANANIYPEGLITGYFGKATEKAIKRLQKENGLEQAGRVGPKTRDLLNSLLNANPIAFEMSSSTGRGDDRGEGKGEDKRPCAMVPPGHLIAPGWLKKDGNQMPVVPPCQTLPKGISDKLGGDWKPGTTTPPVNYVYPQLLVIEATSTAPTTAYVFWTSTKLTTSEFWYGTSTPLASTTPIKLSDNVFSASHSVNLSGLSTSTTYYYQIKVSDERPNSATSTERMLTTKAQ
jgi:peptidoglycan hydrolase-like protein with peptidoglycan-binding domain